MKRYQQLITGLCAGLMIGGIVIVYSAEQEKPSQEFRDKFLHEFDRSGMDTTEGDAMMLRILVEAAGCKRGVEVGSFKGFGAMNMGIAFERTGGHLYTHEINPARVRDCRANLEKVGLQDVVTCVEGDALETLPKLEGEFDFVFLDALKPDYMKYLKIMEPKLKKGAVIVADNVIKSERAMQDFLTYIKESPDYDTVTIRASLEKDDGMTISYKIR